MFTYRRYFWISRILPLAVVGAGVVMLIPSDFKAAAVGFSGATAVVAAQPAQVKVSMPAPKLLVLPAVASAPVSAPTPPDPALQTAALSTTSPDPATLTVSSVEVPPVPEESAATASQLPDAGLADMRDVQIGASGVNVRAGASKDFAVLFTLQPGTDVKARETLNGWVHVYADSGDGWIYGSYLAGSESGSTSTTAAAPVEQQSQTAVGSALIGRVIRVRSDTQVYDNPGGSRIYVLDAGERVRVAEADSNWVRIITESDESGWVRVR